MPDKTDAELQAESGDTAAAEAAAKAKADAERNKQGDEEVVPKRQLIAAVNSAERKTDAERARADALQRQLDEIGRKDQPKQYTRSELTAGVAAGQITQEAADQVWEDQIVARAEARATQVATENVTRARRKERVDSDINRYTALEPDILIEGSDIRNKIAKEFKFLVDMGDSSTAETELKAIRAALGPVEQLELAKSGVSQHSSHRETGGGGGGGKPGKKFEDTLSQREKAYYQKGIDGGRYKDWSEVKKELEFANPNTRRKHGTAG